MSFHFPKCIPFFFFLVASIIPILGYGQVDYFIVNEVILDGNKKTDNLIIFNELDLLPGDTVFLKEFADRKLYNEKRLYSTALFTDVNINIKNWDTEKNEADIIITFQENWYIYPSLIFELADRNFNVWWTEQNRDWSRVNYGLGIDHINLTGRKDRLRMKIQHGYTRKYEAKYNLPYITPTWGMFGEIFYANQREIGYITEANKTLFAQEDDERVMLQRFRTGAGFNHRPTIFHFHDFKLEYHHNQIADIVAQELNPDYFLDNKNGIRFFNFKYDYRYDKRVFNMYPEGGFMLFANITKEGFGVFEDVNNLSIAIGIEKHQKLGSKWILGTRIKGKTNLLRNKVSFANNTGLGYGNDIVRGYELYVVDGTDWVIAKSSLRYQLWENSYNIGKYMILPQFKKMNIRVFLRGNLDFGYVNEPTYKSGNTLNNRVLVGYGPAMDILLYHTYKISIEYSFNHLNEGGLYLRSSFNF